MLKIKIEKDEKHGGFIAREDSDSPLRNIAAAGETEAQACAALLEYHADLIRKDRIKVENLISSERPYCRIGDYAPDVGPFTPEEHGFLITTPLKMRALAVNEGLIPQTGVGNEALVCKVLRSHMAAFRFHSSLDFSQASVKWFKQMLKNHAPHAKKVHGFPGSYFSSPEDVDNTSHLLMTCIARNLYLYNSENISPDLSIHEGEVCDFLKYFFEGPLYDHTGQESSRTSILRITYQYMFLWSALNLRCGLPRKIPTSGLAID